MAAALLVATAANASGSYGNTLLSKSFRYSFTEKARKIFDSGDQQRDEIERDDRELKARFLRFQAKAEKVIADAKKAGTPLGPYDLLLPAVRLQRPQELTKLDKKAYPLNLLLDVSTKEATVTFELTATKPWTVAQLTSLTASLRALSNKVDTSDDGDERTEREKKLVDGAAFVRPVAVTHLGENFGVYVGTTSEVAGAEKDKVLAPLQALLDKLVPLLTEKFSRPEAASELHLTGLNEIGPAVKKHPQGLPGAFHPWGPLVSGELIRIGRPVGGANVILMLSPAGKYEWEKVYPVMISWVEEAVADPHRTLIENEALRLGEQER